MEEIIKQFGKKVRNIRLSKKMSQGDVAKLLGAHIVGEEASNMIHMLIAYINMEATLEDILRTIYIHPALPENIRNAARNAKKNWRHNYENLCL